MVLKGRISWSKLRSFCKKEIAIYRQQDHDFVKAWQKQYAGCQIFAGHTALEAPRLTSTVPSSAGWTSKAGGVGRDSRNANRVVALVRHEL